MSSRLLNRSFEIISSAVKETGAEYTSNLQSLINDARDIKNNITKTTTDASDTFAKLKTTNITKKISDWFYGEENSIDASLGSGDEFDAGFKIDDNESPKLDGEEKPRDLNADAMTDIANRQTATAIKIGRRQNEQSIANTAEIISVMNNRSSEMIASINNVNKSLIAISDRLDKIIKIQTEGISVGEKEKEIDKGGLYSDGQLSLSKIFEAAKKNVSNNAIIDTASTLAQVLTNGDMGPEGLAKMGLSLFTGKQLNALGGQSIDDIGKRFNEAIGTATQSAMNELIGSKAFKNLFGDITSFDGNKDYGTLVSNSYDNKKAQFDGMTRHTIVTLIPEMLATINESISGVGWHISNSGNWTKGQRKNEFNEVTKNAFASSGLNKNVHEKITTSAKQKLGDKFSESDVDVAAKALTAVIVQDLHERGTRQFKSSDLKGDMTGYVISASQVLCGLKNDPEYWAQVCQSIILQLSSGIMSSQTFIQNINQSLQNMMTAAIDFAQSGKSNAKQATTITKDMVLEQFWKDHKDQYNKTAITTNDDNNGKQIDGRIITTNVKAEKYTNNEYLRSIFGILNRGINVHVVGNGTPGFDKYKIKSDPELHKSSDQAFGKAMASVLVGGDAKNDGKLFENTIKNVMSSTVNSLTGGDNNSGGGNGKSGVLGNLFSSLVGNFGGRGLGSLLDRALNGTLKEDLGRLFSKDGQVGKAASEAMGKVKDVTGSITGKYAYDRRVMDAKERVFGEDGYVDKIKGKAGEIKDKIESNEHVQKIKETGSRFANNSAYKFDSMALKGAENRVKNFELDPEELEDDMVLSQARLALQYVGDGALDDAESIAEGIEDSKVKASIMQHIRDLRKIDEIKEKREKGQADLAAGKTPEIGAVIQNAPEKPQADPNEPSTPMELIKKSLSGITSVLGKIAKFVMKIATKGMRDLKYGLLSMKDGLFGSKERDENGNVISENKGLIRNLAIEAPKRVYSKAINAGKNIANKVGDMEFSRHVSDKAGRTITTREAASIAKNKAIEGVKNAKDKILNTTFTGQWERNEDGSVKTETYTNKKGKEKEKKLMTNTATIGDLLKDPKKVLKQSFENITTDLKKSFSNVIKTIKESKIGKVVGAVAGALGKVGKALTNFATKVMKGITDKIKSIMKSISDSKVGQFVKDKASKFKENRSKKGEGKLSVLGGRFTSGMTKGFKKAKEKADEAKKKQSEKEARDANPIQASIDDAISGKKESIITKMHNALLGIGEKLGLIHEEQVEENSGTDDENKSTVDSNSNTNNANTAETNNGETPPTTEETTSTVESGSTGTSEDAGGGGGKKGGLLGDIMGNLGEVFGGFSQALLGIGELIVSIVMSLEGLQALKDLVMSILTEGLQPLNEVFEAAMELIKPIVAILKDMVTTIAETVVTIAKSLIDVIQPIIEAIQPIIKTLLDVLKPILEIIVALVDVVMVPIMIIMKILQPIIENIGYQLQIVSGVLQIGMGIVIGMLGGLLFGLGGIAKLIGKIVKVVSVGMAGSSIEGLGDSLAETGKNMLNTSKSMITSGVDQMKKGIEGMVSQLKAILPGGDDGTKEEDDKKDTGVNTDNVTLGNDFGAGDVNTNTVNNSWTYNYGSGNTTMNQHSYGSYMNMSERGCGPVVLADAYARRTGAAVNPASLAVRMAGSGAYEPNKGTSVGSMVNTGREMGMGLRVGGVTQNSLKQASPSNPITLLGSGTGFGTKSGNSHYVNVVGTDKHGGAYVANPMSGRVERQSATSLTLNSKLGLYGSGDENEYEQYGFNDETTSSIEKLKALTGKLTSMFTGKSKADKMQDTIDAADEENKAKTIKLELGDEYDEIEQQAREQLKADNPKKDGEDDAAYEARIEKLWGKKGNAYIIKLGGQAAYDKGNERGKNMLAGAEEAAAGYETASTAMEKVDLSQYDDDALSATGESTLGATMAEFKPIVNLEPDINDNISSKSPVHDYFAATSGKAFDDDSKRLTSIFTSNGWYGKMSSPDKMGVGKTGKDHEAIAIRNGDKADDVRAITGGTVTYVTTGGKHGNADPNGGLGNSVKWRDDAGMYHWYFHLDEVDKNVKVGNNIEPNQVLGKFGSTGMTGIDDEDAKLIRYVVTKAGPAGSTGDEGHINPLSYWRFEEASDELSGDTEKEQIFNYLTKTLGIPDEGAAGIMGVWQEESTNTAATLEGNYAFDKAKVAEAPKSNASLNKYTENDLFPMYARSGVGIDKNAYKGTDGNYYPGFGLAQWTGPRGKKVMDYAKEKGKDWTELSSQLSYVKDELPAYGDLLDKVKQASTPEKAADIWMTRYEAGGQGENPHNTWLSGSQISAREKNAGDLYSELHGKVIPASTTVSKKDGESITGRFVSTMSNDTGTGEGYFSSTNGATMADFGTPTHNKTNITSSTSGESPVHDFFGSTGGGKTYSAGGNWYGLRHNPDSTGKGSSGDSHGGIDILWEGGTEGKELHAITGGVVDRSEGGGYNGSGSNGGCGNNIRWKDSGGYLHWYMHMKEDPLLKVGDTVKPGQLVGYAGNTGNSYGAHLHYNINDPSKFDGYSSSGAINPLTYFSQFNPTGRKDNKGASEGGFSGAASLGYTNANMQLPQSMRPEEEDRPVGLVGPVKPTGSGDVSDFWTGSIYGSDNMQMDIPPLDPSKFTDDYSESYGKNPIVINKYEMKPDKSSDDVLLKKLSKMTFNVRAQRVEQLLEELIEKVSGDKPSKPNTKNISANDSNLFDDNSIPDQVVRLSRG